MKKTKKIRVGRQERAASFDQATVDKEARTVELSFSSEEPYQRYFGQEILGHKPEECRLGRLNSGGALLCDHNVKDQVGVVESAFIGQDRKGRAIVRFGRSARAEEVFQDVIDGIRKNCSVSYDVHKMILEKTEKDMDWYRVTDWEPLEVSLVSVPADATVGVGRDAATEKGRDLIIEIPEKEEKKKMKKCAICGADYEGESCPVCARARAAAEAQMRAEADAKAKTETSRVNEILAMAKKHDLMDDGQRYISEGKTVQEFKDLVIQKLSTDPLRPEGGQNRAAQEPYKRLGDQLMDVIAAERPQESRHAVARERLITAQRAISGMSTSVPADGGYMIHPAFTTALLDKPEEVSKIWAKCMKIPIGAGFDSLEAPYIDETSRATGSRWGGVQVYREGESEYPAGKKPKLGNYEIRLFDIKGVCYATNRLLQNAVTLEAWIQKSFRSEMFFKLDDEVIRGTGAGQCTGITVAPGTVTVSKESGQAADTIVTENINKMFNALIASSRGAAVWLYNQECEPQLETLVLSIGTGGVEVPMFQFAGQGTNSGPTNRLKGLPAVPVEQASALGDLGDIILADLVNGYITIDQGGIDAQSSIHVKFLEDETAFRFTYRANGAPRLKSKITPYKGGVDHSHFVILQAR
jgi:HK97 family phage major capsid protein